MRTALGLIGAFAFVACSPRPATEIVVRVDTNLTPVSELRSFRIVIGRVGASTPITDQTFELASGRYSFPAALGVTPRDPTDGRRVRVDVTGRLATDATFTTSAIVGFREGHIAVVDMFLARECSDPQRAAACAAMGLTCGRGGECVPVEHSTLPDLDAGTIHDAGLDADVPLADTNDVPIADTGEVDAPVSDVPAVDGGIQLRGQIGTPASAPLTSGSMRMRDIAFESTARACVGSMCITGGITP